VGSSGSPGKEPYPALGRGSSRDGTGALTLMSTAALERAQRKPRLRLQRLVEANRDLTVARVLLRAARDRRLLEIAQHEHAMRLVDGWGRQLGGWMRTERSR
jgi:hypothetical protein